MSDLDQNLHDATQRLRSAVSGIEIPEPQTVTPRRSIVPISAAAALIAVTIGGVALFTADGTDTITPAGTPADESGALPTTAVPPTSPVTSEAPDTSVDTSTDATATGNATATGDSDPSQPERLTNSSAGEVTAPAASLSQVFNADGSLALLYRTGPEGSGHVVFDTAALTLDSESAWTELTSLDLSIATDIEDFFWHPTEPDTLFVLDGAQLVAIDARTATTSVAHEFDGCEQVGLGGTSGSSNSGSPLLAVVCDDSRWIAYDLESTTVVASTQALSADAPVTMASGEGFVHLTDDRVDVLDRSLQPTGVSFAIDASSWTMAQSDDRDVLVATVFDGELIGTVVVLDLETGEQRVVIGPDTGWQYPPTGTRLSRAVGSAVIVSTSPQLGSEEPGRLDDVVLLVDVATGSVTSIVSHAMADGDRFGNWSTPFTALHPDGQTVIFSSDQGGDRVDTFRVPG